MTYFVYDGSFEGFLTAVFEVYNRKASTARIIPMERYQPDAFSERVEVHAQEEKANRVWNGLGKKLSTQSLVHLYSCYLSELPEREELMLSFIQEVFASENNIEENYTSAAVLRVAQIGRQLFREKHRMEAFVRFQQLRDGTFYAAIEPDFNVIPLITAHFMERYADQIWIIYDLRRKYGIYYDRKVVQQVQFDFVPQDEGNALNESPYDGREDLFEELWKVYFQRVNIPARRNLKLHRKHVPIRYWKYLIEKTPNLS